MSSGWGEQPAPESSPEPAAGSGSAGAEGAAAGGAAGGGGALVPVLIIVVVLLVLGGGAAAFLLLRPDRSSAGGGPSIDTPTPIPVSSSSAPVDSPTPETTATPEPPAPPAAAPTNLGPPQISGVPTGGQVLTTTTGSWQDQASLQFAVAWVSCGSLDPKTCVVISGATNETYVVNATDEGKYLLSVVTAMSSDGQSTQVQSAVVGPATAPPNQEVLVPNLVDRLYSTAVELADQAGLTIKVVGTTNIVSPCNKARVVTQNPPIVEPPPQLSTGSTIEVTITAQPKNCGKYTTMDQQVRKLKNLQKQPGG